MLVVILQFSRVLITLNQAATVMYCRLELDNSCVTCVIIFILMGYAPTSSLKMSKDNQLICNATAQREMIYS